MLCASDMPVPIAHISANTHHGDNDDNNDNEESGHLGDGTTRATTAVVAVVENVIQGGAGTCFRDDMVSSLLFVKMHVSVSEHTCNHDMVFFFVLFFLLKILIYAFVVLVCYCRERSSRHRALQVLSRKSHK
jgi:hypothetical protein